MASWIEAVYGDDEPSNTLNEINGASADINKGYGGEYVWLRVHNADSANRMIDNVWLDIRGSKRDGREDDIAKGAGGDYRYFDWSHNAQTDRYISELGLWRSGDEQNNPPHGWNGKTGDINRGRGGDYLYLVWKTKQYVGPK